MYHFLSKRDPRVYTAHYNIRIPNENDITDVLYHVIAWGGPNLFLI